jgi:hypothetical protein
MTKFINRTFANSEGLRHPILHDLHGELSSTSSLAAYREKQEGVHTPKSSLAGKLNNLFLLAEHMQREPWREI